MRVVEVRLAAVAACAILALGPATVAQAQGTDKYEKVTPARPVPAKPVPAKPAPAEPEGPEITAATDPKLRSALAGVPTPIPHDLALRAPGARIAGELRAFYGVWTGKFENGTLCSVIIDSMSGASAKVVQSWGASKNFKAGFARGRGQLQNGTLQTKSDQRTVAYRVLGGDQLEVIFDSSRGINRAVVKRLY